MKTIYIVPLELKHTLEVFGDGEMGWYEYAIKDQNGVAATTTDQQYGSPEIALRDGLIEYYGLPEKK